MVTWYSVLKGTFSNTILGFSMRSYFFNGLSVVSLVSFKKKGNYIIALNKAETQLYQYLLYYYSGCFYILETYQLCAIQITLFLWQDRSEMKHTGYSQCALVAYSSICGKMYASLCDNFTDLFMKHFSSSVRSYRHAHQDFRISFHCTSTISV